MSVKEKVLEKAGPTWNMPSGQTLRMGMASCTERGMTNFSFPDAVF